MTGPTPVLFNINFDNKIDIIDDVSTEVSDTAENILNDYLNVVKAQSQTNKESAINRTVDNNVPVDTNINAVLDTKENATELNKAMEVISNKKHFEKKLHKQDITFYKELTEYHGSICEELDNSHYIANLKDINNANNEVQIEFGIDDLYYASDKKLIAIGTPLIVLTGKEVSITYSDRKFNLGPQTIISRIFVEKKPTLTKRKIKEAKDNASKWIEFLGCEAESSPTE